MAEITFRVATEFDVVKVRLTAEGKQRIERLTSTGCCLGCERELSPEQKVRRGLCDTCYGGVKNAARRKRVSEQQLMREGKLLPPSPGGRKPANAFTASLSGRESEVEK